MIINIVKDDIAIFNLVINSDNNVIDFTTLFISKKFYIDMKLFIFSICAFRSIDIRVRNIYSMFLYKQLKLINSKMNRSDMQFEYICYISGALYYYYSQPVPRFHFTRPWYNKRTTY